MATAESINWKAEIWPFQWRIGLSSLAGFLVFRAVTIVVFAEQNALAAGQFGLAVASMNMLIALTTAWPNSQAAILGHLLSSKRYRMAMEQSSRTLYSSSGFAVLCSLLLWGGLRFAEINHYDFSSRISDTVTMAVVLFTAIIHHLVACQAVLLRAEAKEPLLLPSVIGGAANLTAVWLCAHFGSILDVAIATLICALLGLAITTQIYTRRCAIWKSELQNMPVT